METLQLLRRPRPLPRFRDLENGIYAQWSIKGFFYKKNKLPKLAVRGQARVQYNHLVVQGQFPKFQIKIPLVNIGYVESEDDILDVRGCNFKMLLFGIDNITTIRDWLRFLIIRQRVPHSLMKEPFDWQDQPVKNDKRLKISKISPLNCFRL